MVWAEHGLVRTRLSLGVGTGVVDVLIVEDDASILELIRYNLERAQFRCEAVSTGEEALEFVSRRPVDLVVLDVMLPGSMDGFDVCRAIRRRGETPILMLTARKDEVDRIVGLELGADDYLTKPFSPRELVARVRAILRRTLPRSEAAEERPAKRLLRYRSLTVDLEGRLAAVAGRPLPLTFTEFELLAKLMEGRGRAFTRDALLNAIWGQDYFGDARTVDVHVRHLRSKLRESGGDPEWIETVRGVGYRFRGDLP